MVAPRRAKGHQGAISECLGWAGGLLRELGGKSCLGLEPPVDTARECGAEPSCQQGGRALPFARWWGSSPSVRPGARITNGASEPESWQTGQRAF